MGLQVNCSGSFLRDFGLGASDRGGGEVSGGTKGTR